MSNRRSKNQKISTLQKAEQNLQKTKIEELSWNKIKKLTKPLEEIFNDNLAPLDDFKVKIKEQTATTETDMKEIIKKLAARANSEKKQMEEDMKRTDIDYLLDDVKEEIEKVSIKCKGTNATLFEFVFHKDVPTFERANRITSVSYTHLTLPTICSV